MTESWWNGTRLKMAEDGERSMRLLVLASQRLGLFCHAFDSGMYYRWLKLAHERSYEQMRAKYPWLQ